ncbi:hypothetical protein BASA81_007793 [Batrachochytrium salamandrivorans]|nr:hypothetical protein BASA81_007793 [Batrachochytrium salamandrivorans]
MTNPPSHSINQTEGRWTMEEQELFAQGYELFGRNWKKIASLVKTRNNVQCRTHAQHLQRKHVLGGAGGISPPPRPKQVVVTTSYSTAVAIEKSQRLILASFRQKLAEQRFLLAKLQFHYMQSSVPV